jgi:methyltransferase (TIGR00027 family)
MTALMSAACRGAHRLRDAAPWVFDDPFALSLVGPAWPEILGAMATRFREPILRQATASMVNRSRYAEDRLLAGSFAQYVILGTGLDSFAWRRPDMLRSLRVFEVDHPSTQDWEKDRAAALALPTSGQYVFAPVDFESETLRDGLDAAGFDWSQPTLFSWLGVTQYLSLEAIRATLSTVSGCVHGSESVFTYVPPPAFLDALGLEFLEVISSVAGERGEPFQTSFSPAEPDPAPGLASDPGPPDPALDPAPPDTVGGAPRPCASSREETARPLTHRHRLAPLSDQRGRQEANPCGRSSSARGWAGWVPPWPRGVEGVRLGRGLRADGHAGPRRSRAEHPAQWRACTGRRSWTTRR